MVPERAASRSGRMSVTACKRNAQPRKKIMKAFRACFGCLAEETNSVDFEVAHRGTDAVQRQSAPTAIRRS